VSGRIGRRRLLAGAGLLALAAACDRDKKKDSASGGRPAASGPRQGGVLRSAGGPLSGVLDPHLTTGLYVSAGIWHWAGNFLVRFTRDGLLEPDLALAMPEVADGTTLTFKLNPAARWQPRDPVSGRIADSEDVKFTFERIKDPATGSPRAALFANLDTIETPDAYTVVLKTKTPEADLPAKLADQYQIIAPKEWVGKEKPVRSAADVVGTGPYVLESYAPEKGFRLSRRPDGYWKPNSAWLDGWSFTRVDDRRAQLAAAHAGSVDAVDLTADALKEFQSDVSRWYVLQSRSTTRDCLLLNQEKPFYGDVRVRQAIWRALDRTALYATLFAGLGTSGGPMSPAVTPWLLPDAELASLPGFRPDRDAELTEAKQLLAADGYADGFEDVLLTATAFQINDEGAQYAAQLARIGIRYQLENTGADFGAALQRQVKKEYSAAATLFPAGPYPDAQLNLYLASNAPRNYAGYANPQMDALLDAQSHELDANKRKELVFGIQRELITNPSGFIWIGSRTTATAYRTYLKGISQPNFPAGFPIAEDAFLER
jgi:peptide/nickel transport system substrate-binding protein